MFKIGDYVRLQDETLLDTDEVVNGWGGQVKEIYENEEDENTYLISFDALTINKLTDDYLITCIEDGTSKNEYIFLEHELSSMERRDTEKSLELALKELDNRIRQLEAKFDEAETDALISDFIASDFYQKLNPKQQENSNFILSLFHQYLYDYQGIRLKSVNAYEVQAVCLGPIPRKITSEKETFENVAPILIQFFHFLEDTNYLEEVEDIVSTLKKIDKQIVKISQNPENWGPAKSMMMGAMDAGVDMDDPAQIDNYINQYNTSLFEGINRSKSKSLPAHKIGTPAKENPYKHIGRNDKVNVEYENGTVKKDIKFKKVEQDLRAGKCFLL